MILKILITLLLDNVDFGVLKKMRDLLPFLDSKLLASSQDIQQFFRLAYRSPLAKGICVPDSYRQRFRDLMIKARIYYLIGIVTE